MINKIKSRKFIAWIVWTLLTVGVVVFTTEHLPTIIPWYGSITLIYIGGQALLDGFERKGK